MKKYRKPKVRKGWDGAAENYRRQGRINGWTAVTPYDDIPLPPEPPDPLERLLDEIEEEWTDDDDDGIVISTHEPPEPEPQRFKFSAF